jgi:hypothetical protein
MSRTIRSFVWAVTVICALSIAFGAFVLEPLGYIDPRPEETIQVIRVLVTICTASLVIAAVLSIHRMPDHRPAHLKGQAIPLRFYVRRICRRIKV